MDATRRSRAKIAPVVSGVQPAGSGLHSRRWFSHHRFQFHTALSVRPPSMGINCLPSSAELCIICAGSVAWAMADSRITIRQLANAHAAGTLACLEFGSTEEIVFRQLANAHAAGALACLEFGSTEKIVFRMWRLPGPWLMLLSISSCVRLTTKSLAMLPTKRLSIASKSPFVMLLTSSLSLASKSSRTITIRRKPSSLPRIPMRSAR